MKQTYVVLIEAVASKRMTIRAESEEDAIEIAWTRADRSQTGWLIDLPGDERDHIRAVFPQ